MKILTSFHLKILALTLMVGDHLGYILPEIFPVELRYAGRIVAPLFFFIVVESFFHTRSRAKFLKRLYIWAFIMAVGNVIMRYVAVGIFSPENIWMLKTNIFLSLALGVTVITLIDWVKKQTQEKNKVIGVMGALIIVCVTLFTEFGYLGLATILLFYFLHNKKFIKYFAFVILSSIPVLALLLQGGLLPKDIYFPFLEFQWMMVFALPLIMLYNGKRGPRLKYFFYSFYPLHLWVLYLISYIA